MMWLGWLMAGGLALAFYRSNDQDNKARSALATLQVEVAKLAQLWAAEVVQRRKLQDEYDRPTDTVRAECLRRYTSAEEPYFLFPTSVFEPSSDHLFADRRAPLHEALLDADPVSWGKKIVPIILSYVAKRYGGDAAET